eukprot:scaffold20532_cov123-Isochrysis_galbana.AAC.7
MRNTSFGFGGRARCGCRSVPGNVGVGTRPRLQAPELCSRAGSARAWRSAGVASAVFSISSFFL